MKPDLEDVIDACMQVFQEQFPAVLAAVDARKSKPLSPKPPVDWIFGDKENLPNMPCLLFTGRRTEATEDEYGWRKQTYQLIIEAYYLDQDVQCLNRIMRRYGAAIDDTLRQNQTLGGAVKNVTNIQQEYWDTMRGNSGLFQAVRVTFDAQLFTD